MLLLNVEYKNDKKNFFKEKKKMLVILEILLTKAVSRGIHDHFRLMVIGFMFSPQLNPELQLLLLNWLGYISCQHFKMTFLLKNRNYPDIIPWVFAEPDIAAAVQTIFIYGWAYNLLSLQSLGYSPLSLLMILDSSREIQVAREKERKTKCICCHNYY